MDSTSFNEYLEKRYYDQLNYYRGSSSKNQKKYKNFQWILIVLSALTPVLVAMDLSKYNLDIIVIIVSSLVAILTSGLKTFQYQELWANYRATSEQLKPEIHYYNFNVGPYGISGVDKEALFISRVEAILDKEHQNWPPTKKISDNNSIEIEEQNNPTDETTNRSSETVG